MRAISAFALILASAPAAALPPPAPSADVHQPDQMHCATTPAEATALRSEVSGRFQPRAEGDRFIAYDDVANHRIWMFTTEAHPAHPSVACVDIVRRDGVIGVQVQITCFATTTNCASLNREFEERGARVRQALTPH